MWVAILCEHLPWCFVLLVRHCLYGDLVLTVFLPQMCFWVLTLLPIPTLENHSSMLSCAQGTTIELWLLSYLKCFIHPGVEEEHLYVTQLCE